MNPDPTRTRLPIALWPQPDRDAWKAAFEGPAWARPDAVVRWSQATCARVESGYGRWLGFLERTGRLSQTDPAARVTREAVVTFVELLQGQVRPISITGYLGDLINGLKVLAPEFDSRWIRIILASIKQRVHPDPGKRARVRDSRDLWDLGLHLMTCPPRSGRKGPILTAIDYRDGLLIALLAARPVRLANLTIITIGEHLVQVGSQWQLLFASHETKQRRAIEFPLPEALVPYLERYLEVHRPRFRNAGRLNCLWIGREGKALEDGSIRDITNKRTRQAFGTSINPHLFRNCAASSLATYDPEHVFVSAPLLGHSTLDTSYRYYNQASTLSAGRDYQGHLQSLRERLTAKRWRHD